MSRLNNKKTGCIIIIMQRLHEDDLVGHVLEHKGWTVIRLPAIAEEEEIFTYRGPLGQEIKHIRRIGDILHPEREPLEILNAHREIIGEYNFAGQYQQAPAPLDGGMIKARWFKSYNNLNKPAKFDLVFQSWDTANKATELSDHSVCTTWGYHQGNLYLLDVLRMRLEYPELKRLISTHGQAHGPKNILIEDKASGTQLIQELQRERVHSITRYTPTLDKIMRMHSVTPTIENGLVYLPEKAEWLAPYLHELTTFPNGKNDDQVDSTSQALDWIKKGHGLPHGLTAYLKGVHEGIYPYPIPPEPNPWQRRF